MLLLEVDDLFFLRLVRAVKEPKVVAAPEDAREVVARARGALISSYQRRGRG